MFQNRVVACALAATGILTPLSGKCSMPLRFNGACVTNELRDEVASRTEALRTGTDTFWVHLRRLLRAQSVDPTTAILACLEPEAPDDDYGFIVSADSRLFAFILHWDGEPESAASFLYWQEWTDVYRANPHSPGIPTESVRCAFDLSRGAE